jgi:hypothetical protein
MAKDLPLELDFSADESLSVQIPVKGPDGKRYLLKSGSGKVVTEYRNASQACFKYGTNGRLSQIVNLASVEVQLVSGCLFETDGNGDILKRGDKEVNVPALRIDSWPNPVKSKLFSLAKQVSGLDEDADPLRTALEAALRRDDSPVRFQVFRDWVLNLPEDIDALRPLRKLLEEEPSKNVPSASTAGSE